MQKNNIRVCTACTLEIEDVEVAQCPACDGTGLEIKAYAIRDFAFALVPNPVTPPTTPAKNKPEPKCPNAPKKAPAQRRNDLPPIPKSPALRDLNAPANWCNFCNTSRDVSRGQTFCSKCGNGLVHRAPVALCECLVCHGKFERQNGDMYCGCCGSNLCTPFSNYPLGFVELVSPVAEDMCITMRFGNWRSQVVVMKGTAAVGVLVPTNLSPAWDQLTWTIHPARCAIGVEPKELAPKLIRLHGDRLTIYMH